MEPSDTKSQMALLRDYNQLGAERLFFFTDGVVIGLSSDSTFSSLAAEVANLNTLNKEMDALILPFGQSTTNSKALMLVKKGQVIEQLDVIRPLAEGLCNGDFDLENLTGFTPSKRVRSRRTAIDAAQITAVEPTGVPGYLRFTLAATIPGNTGYEIHYVLDGKDMLVGIGKVKGRTLQFVAGGFPSLVKINVYLITLSTNNVYSVPSNWLSAAAS